MDLPDAALCYVFGGVSFIYTSGFVSGWFHSVFLFFGLSGIVVGLFSLGIATVATAISLAPIEWRRRVFCGWLNIHFGPIETYGYYSYINCRRCGGLRNPTPRYYAEQRFKDRR